MLGSRAIQKKTYAWHVCTTSFLCKFNDVLKLDQYEHDERALLSIFFIIRFGVRLMALFLSKVKLLEGMKSSLYDSFIQMGIFW